MTQQRIVITGAGSGLGKSLAKKLIRQGHHVFLLGRTEEKLKLVDEETNGKASVYTLDVSKKSDVSKTFQSIQKEHGPVDILINNAGTGSFSLAETITEHQVDAMIDINLKGTIFCTQEVLPTMKENSNGMIVNIVSTAGKVGKVNESVYCASKFGVRGFTESLFAELAQTNIKVFGVYMGGMRTEFWNGIFDEEQMKHLMDPDDVADIILENMKPRPYLNVEEVVIKNKKS